MIRNYALLAAATAMAVAPVAANAAPQRMPAPVSEEAEELRGSPVFIILLVAILVGLGIILLSDDNRPASP